MITRGYLIGEIIDILSSISGQVETRCKLGLTDLNKYLEDFFCEILNLSLDLSLINVNKDRSNSPGIDLYDASKQVAFQITSTASISKIKDTLKNSRNYQEYEINVFIIGKKQNSYSMSDNIFSERDFSEDNIWDVNTLCKRIISMPLDNINDIYQYIMKEQVHVRIELEIPDQNGNYETSIKNYVEPLLEPRIGSISNFRDYILENNKDVPTTEELKSDIQTLVNHLKVLPRITREFYAFIIERGESDRDGIIVIKYNVLKRLCRSYQYDEEILLLDKLIFHNLSDDDLSFENQPTVSCAVAGVNYEYLITDIKDYASKKSLDIYSIFRNIDFSGF